MHQNNEPQHINRKKQKPELYKQDGEVLSPQEAEEIALKRFSFGSGWRTTQPDPKGGPHSKFRDHLSRMKQVVKNRTGGVLSYFTAPPAGSQQATDKEIAEEAKNIKLDYYSPEVVRCFHDIISGGRFLPPSLWLEQIRKKKMNVKKTQEHLNGLVRTIKSIDFEKIPGKTSLQKAVAAVKLLGLIDSSAAVDDGSSNDNFYGNSKRESDVLKKLNETLDAAQDLEATEVLLLGGRLATENHNELELTVELIESLLKNNAAQLITRVARLLDKLPKLKIEGERTIQKDSHGLEIRSRQMESINELPKIAKSHWAFFMDHPELFWSKAFNLEYPVREHISRQSQKQLLYLLIDSSGSMSSGNRIQLALAVLLNRLKGVINGEALLQFRFFDTEVFTEYAVNTTSEAEKAIQMLQKNNFSGGGTNITHAIRMGVDSILKKQLTNGGINPHMAIVSDGCDSVSLSLADLKGVTLHAFLIGDRNNVLEQLAKASGGTAVILEENGNVLSI